MNDIFRRRRRNPYVVPGIALALVAAGVLIWRYALPHGSGLPETPELTSTAAAQSTPDAVHASATVPATAPAPAPAASQAPAVGSAPASTPAPALSPAAATPATRPAPAATTAPVPTTGPTSLPSVAPGSAMAEAQRLMDAGDFLAARDVLNPVIVAGTLPAEQQRSAMQLQEKINRTLIFSPRRFPNDPWVDSYVVKPGDMLQKICPPYNMTAKFVLRINGIPDARRVRANSTIKLVKGPFHAIVTKSTFTMDLYLGAPGGEGSLYVCSFPVGLGQDDSTPTGRWMAEQGKKLIKPKYYDPRGGGVTIEAGDPTNPLGDYWIGLTGTDGAAIGRLSYGIHGTIEPDSIGKMASMGCIRMRNEDVAVVYEMLIDGKSIVIVNP